MLLARPEWFGIPEYLERYAAETVLGDGDASSQAIASSLIVFIPSFEYGC